ncbi:flagellar filament capping protein FliD [Nocardioides caricicola]|uniref:Flagellar hook-associated protein 2 n=1 Tax=Nocardioides caricicola TaxID=634770 RepID=A0ABW0N3F8_9ACTN
MATSSISGLASGLNTAEIIDQLMQLEALPQTRLENQQATEKAKLAALRATNTDTTLLRDKADALSKATTWQTVKGTVTGPGATGVTVKVAGTALANTFNVTVDKLAARTQLGFTDSADMSDVVVAGAGIKITTHDGTVHDIATGGGTLTELVSAINASSKDTGVSATAVKTADGTYRLLAQSTATGATTDFTLTNDDESDLLGGATVSAGSDAQISLGAGITATSSSNTFTNLAPGVDVTLDPSATIGSKATVTVAQDPTTITDTVKALVTQLNSLLGGIDGLTATKTATSAGGALAGDSTARGVRNSLLETVFVQGGTSTMADVGIQTDRYGKLVFDEAKFKEAYAKDPAAVAAMFTAGATTAEDGWAARLKSTATLACDRVSGTLTSAIASRDATVTRFTKSIADWDDRLELRRAALEKQYSALETALSGLQSQGNWLASQIAGLPSWS